jgi:hypothetical protein
MTHQANTPEAEKSLVCFQGPDGRRAPCGCYEDEDEAVRFAQAEASEGAAIEAGRGRHGEPYTNGPRH